MWVGPAKLPMRVPASFARLYANAAVNSTTLSPRLLLPNGLGRARVGEAAQGEHPIFDAYFTGLHAAAGGVGAANHRWSGLSQPHRGGTNTERQYRAREVRYRHAGFLPAIRPETGIDTRTRRCFSELLAREPFCRSGPQAAAGRGHAPRPESIAKNAGIRAAGDIRSDRSYTRSASFALVQGSCDRTDRLHS